MSTSATRIRGGAAVTPLADGSSADVSGNGATLAARYLAESRISS